MLINMDEVIHILSLLNVKIRGILHVGAHQCEELNDYHRHGLDDVVWIEANQKLVEENKQRGVNIIHAAVSNVEQDVTLHVANNGQSSSLLDLGTHLQHYPHIQYCDEQHMKSTTLQRIFQDHQLDVQRYNFWNLDIQGLELKALQGAENIIDQVDVIYTEVNIKELYQGCDLMFEMDYYLETCGFVRLSTVITSAGWGDALYVNHRFFL